jgi:hypothetical protein
MSDVRKACARCGRLVCVNASRPVVVVICGDCKASDPWYVQAVAS